MHPDFAYMKPDPEQDTVQINVRAIPEVRRLLHYIAQLDDGSDGIGGVVLEGIGRVIEDRLLDPEYRARYEALRQADLAAHERDLAGLEAIAERFSQQVQQQ
jgi:hypothetical protein